MYLFLPKILPLLFENTSQLCENTPFSPLFENTHPHAWKYVPFPVPPAAVHYNQLHNVVGRRSSSIPFSDRQLLGHHAGTDRHWSSSFLLLFLNSCTLLRTCARLKMWRDVLIHFILEELIYIHIIYIYIQYIYVYIYIYLYIKDNNLYYLVHFCMNKESFFIM